jgi:hypothetical protein
MLLLHETVVLEDSILQIELHHDLRYRLSWRAAIYENNRIRSRNAPYEFRSVEQLRYDFERDAQKT